MVRYLQPPAIALMARQRLLEIRDSLRRKRDAAPAQWKPIEARVLFLAEQALAVTNLLPSVPVPDFPGAFASAPGETTSKFFVMGALGPTMPAFSSLSADGQDWLYQTLRKGTRDDRRERVDASTVKFAVAVWTRARELIGASSETETAKAAHLERAKAFFLGHLCHIAGEVVTGPGLTDAAWQTPGPALASPLPGGVTGGTDRAYSRDVVDATIDDAVKQRVLAPSAIRRDHWVNWLPTESEVPEPLFRAFAEAATAIYDDGKRRGWSDFETAFAGFHALPDVTKDWIAEGFSTMRSIMGTSHDWGYWTWAAMLTPIALPSLVTVPAFSALTQGKLITEDAHRGDERPWWEVLALQYATSGCVTSLYVLIFNLASFRGFSQEAWVALVIGAIVLGFSIACFALLGDAGASGTTRWLMLIIPVVLELFYAFIYIPLIRGGGGRYNRVLAGLFVMHIVMSLLPLAYLAIQDIASDLRKGEGAAVGWWFLWSALAFGLGVAAPAGILFALGAWGTSPARDAYLLERRYLRLFDDGVLVSDADVPTPTLAQLYYPTGDDGAAATRRRRKLLTLWFEGGTKKAYVRPRGDRIEVRFAAAQPAPTDPPDVTVALPSAPLRLPEYRTLLEKVRETGGGAGALKARVELPESEVLLLGEGPILGDGAEDDLGRSQADRLTEIGKWRELGSDADHGLPVFHATKARFAVQTTGTGAPVTAVVAVDEADGGVIALQPPAGTATPDPAAGPTGLLGAGTRFLRELAPGDIIQVGAPASRGVVLAIQDDLHLTTVVPVTGIPAAGAQVFRVAADRRYDQVGPGVVHTEAGASAAGVPTPAGAVVTTPPRVIGSGTRFSSLFQPGDLIRASWTNTAPGIGGTGTINLSGTEERRVTRVVSDTVLEIDAPFSTDIDAVPPGAPPPPPPPAGPGSPYVRVGGHARDGLRPVGTGAADLLSGDTAMDHAADLAALLCMGGVSHLMSEGERQPTVAGVNRFPGPQPLGKVYQCFRNWNLDRRRVNEWKMLITGGARSEKRGRPAAEPDALMLPPDENWRPQAPGEDIANRIGWVPVLRRWLDVARRAGNDVTAPTVLRPGDPSNLELSRGLAFLLDLPDPGVP
ncbi:MAG TPA: hypothetical protein VFK02_28280 [Kofleriaceae bacterium]|nr:hypothetical protein [Kofleriaceae bacterium]